MSAQKVSNRWVRDVQRAVQSVGGRLLGAAGVVRAVVTEPVWHAIETVQPICSCPEAPGSIYRAHQSPRVGPCLCHAKGGTR